MNITIRRASFLILAFLLLALVANCGSPTPPPLQKTPTSSQPTATPTPAYSLDAVDDGASLPPQVLRHRVDVAGENRDRTALDVIFDQAMSPEQTGQAWALTDAEGQPVTGKVTWPTGDTLRFIPDQPLQAGVTYIASISDQAASADGQPLRDPYRFEYTTQPGLGVIQAFPAPDTSEVETKSVITVVFNRPVVPLVTAEGRADLPVPMRIEPETPGSGEWVNTSVYVFHPESLLRGAAEYTITVPAGLADVDGQTSLDQDYTWQFSTAAPGVDSFWFTDYPWEINPPSGKTNVPLKQSFTIRFRQPMDRASTLEALSIVAEDGTTTPLDREWLEDDTTLVITPTQMLELETDYRLVIDASAEARGGGGIGRELDWDFTSVRNPAVVSSLPANGSTQEWFGGAFELRFASRMRISTVKDKVIFDPPLKEEPSWFFYGGDFYSEIFIMGTYGLATSTDYTVTLLPGMEDIYGNKIQEGQTIRFRSAAYSPYAYLRMPRSSPVLYRQGTPQDLYVSCLNANSVNVRLYRLSPETYAKMKDYSSNLSEWDYRPPESDLLWSRDSGCSSALDDTRTLKYTLATSDGEPLQPGLYFLTLDSPDVTKYGNPYLDQRILLVASTNLTFKSTITEALAWVTDLTSGEPVEGVPVVVYDFHFKPIGQGTSDADGLVYIDGLSRGTEWYEGFFAMTDDPDHYGFAYSSWGSGISPYEFGLWTDYYSPPNQGRAYVYTDRPLYRPGQPVYFKGIVRLDDDLAYRLPEQQRVQVIIASFEAEVFNKTFTLSDYGSFSGELLLDEAAALGEYTISVRFPGQEDFIDSVAFGVADYRKADFNVEMESQPEDLLPGETFTTTIQAEYFAGGPLVYANVNWTLQAASFYFSPPGEYSGYNFEDFDQDAAHYDFYFGRGGDSGVYIGEGKTTTDENGHASVSQVASLSESGTSRQLTFEAAVTDFAGTVVAGRDSVVVHRSAVYPGIRPQSYVGQVGKEQSFDVVALDWDGQVLPGQLVDVEIVERRWYSVQEQEPDGRLTWSSSVEDIPVASFEGVVLDEKGEAEVSFTPAKGGVYRALVTSLDASGNQGRASAFMWVAGEGYIPWRQDNRRSFDLVKDRQEYAPGDTAELLIASPLPGVNYALLTVERGHLRYQEVLKLESNSTIYRLPITSDMAPNVYVSVLVMRGAGEGSPPDFRQAITELKVTKTGQEIHVEVTPDRAQASPGESIQYTVRTTDSSDQPVSAEVSLGLSDLAALSLRDPNSQPILDYFYYERGLSVWTAVPLVFSIEDFNAELAKDEALTPEGQGGGSGGGKGYGEPGVIKVRGYFPDTAYWKADVVTDESGQATVEITLPDTLTTWRMDGRAVTLDTRVGQSLTDVVSTKPLLVRPQTPRFFVTGDQVTLGAAVHNNTGEDLIITVSLEARGLELDTPAAQDIEVPTGRQAYVTWQGRVPADSTRVDLVFTAIGGDFSDASLPPLGTLEGQGLPVYQYEAPETVGTSGMLLEDGTIVEAIRLPPEWDVTQGELTVRLAPSLAAGMTEGLVYLEHYPYECVEQTISRFLPNVLTTQALKAAGLSDPDLEAGLETEVEKALQRLYSWQNPDGGWGWWGLKKSDPLTSAYVVLGFVQARQAGYTISEDALQDGIGFVKRQLRKVEGLTEPWELNRQAFFLYVLSQAGQPAVSNAVQLYEERQNMAIYARAYLAETLYQIDQNDPRVQTLLTDFNTAAFVSATGTHWEEKEVDYWNWNTDTRTTAIVLSAVSQIDSSNPLNANAVRWLMSHRTEGHWASTQETAWVLMALTRWMVASGELKADYEYAVSLNGERLGGGFANAETLRTVQELSVDVTELLADTANRLAIAHSTGPGNLYYTAHLNLWLPVDQIPALNQGIQVERSYFLQDDPSQPVTQAKVGDLLLVRLTVVSPGALHYLVVDDPLPAGLEAVDQSLKTSPTPLIPEDFRWDRMDQDGWGWWHFEHAQLRDEKLVLSTTYLPAGTYVYTYVARASTPGTFQVIPTTAQEFYFPDVYGRTAGSVFTVLP